MCTAAKTRQKNCLFAFCYLFSEYLKNALLSLNSVLQQDENFTVCLVNPFPRYYADFFSLFVNIILNETVTHF